MSLLRAGLGRYWQGDPVRPGMRIAGYEDGVSYGPVYPTLSIPHGIDK